MESWQSPVLITAAVALLAVDLALLRPRSARSAAAFTAMWTAAGLGFTLQPMTSQIAPDDEHRRAVLVHPEEPDILSRRQLGELLGAAQLR